MNLRVAILPMVGVKFQNDSNFYNWLQFANWLVRQGSYVYFCAPAEDIPELPKLKGITWVATRDNAVPYEFWSNHASFDSEALITNFSRMWGKYPVDFIATGKHSVAAQISMQLGFHCVDYTMPVMLEMSIRPDGKTYQSHLWYREQIMSFSHCATVFGTESDQKFFFKNSLRYLSPTYAMEIRKRSCLAHAPLNLGPLEKVLEVPDEKRDKFTLIYGGRLNAPKRVDDVLKFYGDYLAAGHDVNVVVSTAADGSSPFVEKAKAENKQIEWFYKMNRERYYGVARRCHAYVVCSKEEAGLTPVWELSILGVVGILPRYDYVMDLLPDWYPYTYKPNDRAAAHAMIQRVRDNYEEASGFAKRLADYARHEFSEDRVYGIRMELLNKVFPKELAARIGDPLRELCKQSIEKLERVFPKGVPFRKVLDQMQKDGKSFAADQTRRMRFSHFPTDFDVLRSLTDSGWQDTCEEEQPVLVRVE